MFVFFINNMFYSFWQNKRGDAFFDLTIKALGLTASQVSLNYYAGVNAIPEFIAFDVDKNLLIQEKVITQGEIVEEEFITTQTITPEIFAVNGEKVLLC